MRERPKTEKLLGAENLLYNIAYLHKYVNMGNALFKNKTQKNRKRPKNKMVLIIRNLPPPRFANCETASYRLCHNYENAEFARV